MTKPQRKSQSQRRDESQAKILSAAVDLLIEKGFDRFSLHDVGKLAKCSHELVNFYFGNKEGLLNALATHIIRNITDELLAFDNIPNAFDQLAARIRFLATIGEHDRRTFTAYIRMAGEAPFSTHLSDLYRARRAQTVDIFRQTIVTGKARGDIRRSANDHLVAHVCYDFVRGHVDRQLLDQDVQSTAEFHAIIDAFISMLRAQIAIRKRTLTQANGDTGDEDQPDAPDLSPEKSSGPAF